MKFAVSISTYRRNDGKTPFYLDRALSSVFKQKYQGFKIFLIGDRYENPSEINSLIKKYPSDLLYFENLSIAKERDVYTDPNVIWRYGGVNAINHSISVALKEGFEYVCHLDHDDYWQANHLLEINQCLMMTGAAWVCTKSTHGIKNKILPQFDSESKCIEAYPASSKLIHSSVCMNFKKIPLRYRNIFAITKKIGLPADADLWERTREYLKENKLKSYYINSITCMHEEEGYSKK